MIKNLNLSEAEVIRDEVKDCFNCKVGFSFNKEGECIFFKIIEK